MRNEIDSDSPKTILHIIDALNYGGAQKLLVLLARWTPPSKYRTIVCVLQTGIELKTAIESAGVKVVCLYRPRPSILFPFRLATYIYRNIRDIFSLCKRERVDVVLCHLSDAEFLGILAAKLAGTSRILTFVHYPDLLPVRKRNDLRNSLRLIVTKILYRWADYIIAVSKDVAGQLKQTFRLDTNKIYTMVNRIDVDTFARAKVCTQLQKTLGLAPQSRIITTVGRLMPPKGHTYLIDAIAALSTRFKDLKLLLVGNGDLRQSLQSQCEKLGLQQQAIFLGNRPDVAQILALTQIFVLPSLWEGTSLALLEAMAAGKPIVATAIPGNQAILEHQQNSYLVQPGDSHALTEGITFLLKHPRLARGYGQNAQDLAKRRFDIRTTVTALEKLWATAA